MRIARRLGGTLLAPMFVVGGVDAFRNPESKAAKAESVTDPVAHSLGFRDDPVALVRVNAGVQILGGALLGLGVCRRLAAFALAVSLVPTTLAGHRFWDESEPKDRANQRTQFLKNAAMLGGLVLVAADAA